MLEFKDVYLLIAFFLVFILGRASGYTNTISNNDIEQGSHSPPVSTHVLHSVPDNLQGNLYLR